MQLATTNSISVDGVGFVPGSTVLVGGVAVPTTYVSAVKLTAQVGIPARAIGKVSLSIQNPAPASGVSGAFQLSVATATIQLSASTADGRDSGIVRLGATSQFTATVQGTADTALTWAVQGAGTISSSGLYQAPAAMPASATVIVTAANSSVATSYSFSLANPKPAIYSAYTVQGPLQLATTNTVTIDGAGFVPASKILVNSSPVATTYVSAQRLTAAVAVPSVASGTYAITVQNPDPGGSISSAFQLKITTATIQLSASTADGRDSGIVRLGATSQFSATIKGTADSTIAWTIQGAGAISSAGLYQAPATMPGSASVIVTATLTTNSSIRTSYAFSLANPKPAIYSSYTAQGPLQLATTNTVTLDGAGFVPASKVLVNGSAVATTYVSGQRLTAAIAVPSVASGTYAITVQNPDPGGSLSSAFQLKITTATIQLSASTADGRDSGIVRLGATSQFSATIKGTADTTLAWTVQGSGTTSSTGLYQAPAVMPASASVIVTATLTTNLSVTTSYSFSLANPKPAIYSAYTTQGALQLATTNTVTIDGAGFVPASTVLVNGSAVPSSYVSAQRLTAAVSVPSVASGAYAVTVQNPNPGSSISSAFQLKITTATIQLSAATADGRDSGIVRLGATSQFSATIKGTADSTIAWTIQGAGAISSSGLYQAPVTMPASTGVIIIATLTTNSSVTTSYPFSLANPKPAIYTAYTAQGPLQLATTNTVTVDGAGFVPASKVLVNGSAVATTYQSSGRLIAAIAVPASASGSFSIAVQNPDPGGSLSIAFQLKVAGLTLQLSAFSASGASPTAVRLGLSVQFTSKLPANASPNLNPAVTWSIQSGGGTITNTGLYQAPLTMPASASATIVATLVANPTVTGAYTLQLLNPLPVVNSANPGRLTAGVDNFVTLMGQGFAPGAIVLVNGSAVASSYGSYSSLTATISVAAGQTGSVSVTVQNPNPGGSTSSPFSLLIGGNSTASAQISLTPGITIPRDFLGWSHEWDSLAQYMGSSQTAVNPIYRQLLRNLMMSDSSYPFFIRIGGVSTDKSGPPSSTVTQPLVDLSTSTPVKFSLGVNLGSDDVQLAHDQAQYYLNALPAGSVSAIEIGNEPDTYATTGMRASSYTFNSYLPELQTWENALSPLLPNSVKYMGPSWGSTGMLRPDFTPFENNTASAVSIISQHVYAGYQETQQIFLPDFLLTTAAATQGPAAVAPYVSMAHQQGQKFRIGEINSIDLGGVAGISDGFSAALWALDTMFEYANVGVDGVNWHGLSHTVYAPFDFGVNGSGSNIAYNLRDVKPLYYGMLLFQLATKNNAQLLPVTLQSTSNLKVWATEESNGVVHVVIINKDPGFSGTVSITATGFGDAAILRLLAPNYTALNGVSLGGQTFDGSLDGMLVGSPQTETVSPTGSLYQVSVAPTSAVLLTFAQ